MRVCCTCTIVVTNDADGKERDIDSFKRLLYGADFSVSRIRCETDVKVTSKRDFYMQTNHTTKLIITTNGANLQTTFICLNLLAILIFSPALFRH